MAKMYRKVTQCGGEGGSEWDDDVYEGVRKIYVGQDFSRITYVKFEYVKVDGQVVTSEYGTKDENPQEFVLEYPDEHIVAVEGSYNKVGLPYAKDVITSLVFKTSKSRKSPTFGPNVLGVVNGTKFVFENEGKKIVGFHGRSGDALDALGVYFEVDSVTTTSAWPSPLYKLDAQGGNEGTVWDDGSYDGVITLRICQDDSRITYLEFVYAKGGLKTETRQHGVKGETPSEFVLNFPNEYMKSVEATYDKPSLFRNTVITSLTFQTSKERTFFAGYKQGKKFVLEQKDHILVGFHGKEGEAIDSLGAYFAPHHAPTPTPLITPIKLGAIGSLEGVIWDDGVYDDVKAIGVGYGPRGISFVQFYYRKGTNQVPGDDHGPRTFEKSNELMLEEGEYLTCVEANLYTTMTKPPVLYGLRFKTNKRETSLFGTENGQKITLGKDGYKIVGFHGRASDIIDSIGVTIALITTNN